MDIETDFPRECLVSLSFNSFREVSVISAGFSMDYTECIQAQANKITQAEQVKSRKIQNSSLFYILLKDATLNTVSLRPVVEPMHIFYIMEINCKNTSQSLKPLVILYQANQSVDLQLQNGNFCPISLFRVDNYLEGDAKNVTCSLLRMVMFIKQYSLENRLAKDIPQIVEFGFIT